MSTVLVRGTGDIGSAVASLLFRDGHTVVLHDAASPPHARRGMAFVDALYEGSAELDGLLAKRAPGVEALPWMLGCRRALPVTDAPLDRVVAEIRPDVVVDARMHKRQPPDRPRDLAPLVIGLGPSFDAGVDVDIAIETQWGDDLGAIVRRGPTRALAGDPQPIDGHTRDRFVYAPVDGRFRTELGIGDAVVAGAEIGRLGDTPVVAPLTGCLRGLAHDGADVRVGAKIVEVDPRGDVSAVRGLGERPRRIAQGVLRAVNDTDAQR
ncbi:MAG TPA: xanthine dehydrogenase [Casimicrobiaceae bacterium]